MALQAEHFQAPQDQTAEKRELTRSKGMSQLRAEIEGGQGSQLRQRCSPEPHPIFCIFRPQVLASACPSCQQGFRAGSSQLSDTLLVPDEGNLNGMSGPEKSV